MKWLDDGSGFVFKKLTAWNYLWTLFTFSSIGFPDLFYYDLETNTEQFLHGSVHGPIEVINK
jgi:hypothetical protein